ncbi:MAG: hypothetical protein IPF57_25460 [Gammaproteobacteria bacterium]|nr:hypothetical protein [Gammaproteobacteria bacterium]
MPLPRRLAHGPGSAGSSAAESARRLLRDGRNGLRTVPPDPLWRRILAQFRDPLIYLLLAAVDNAGRLAPRRACSSCPWTRS